MKHYINGKLGPYVPGGIIPAGRKKSLFEKIIALIIKYIPKSIKKILQQQLFEEQILKINRNELRRKHTDTF